MPLQWRNQIWQSLAEGAGKRCSECESQPGSEKTSASCKVLVVVVVVVVVVVAVVVFVAFLS